MNLQYQLSNGNWIDCGDRATEFLNRAVGRKIRTKTGFSDPIANTDVAVLLLETGRELSIGSDWNANIRIKPAPVAPRPIDPRPVLRCRCGNSGHAGSYPFSTMPDSGRCDDCV